MMSEENNKKRFISDGSEYRFTINGKSENIAEEIEKRKKEDEVKAMQKYMPIGSVVKTKTSFQYYMIIGFNSKNNDTVFDYLACEYPFGLKTNNSAIMFNHDDIEKIFHIGFVNNQEKYFKKNLEGNGVDR